MIDSDCDEQLLFNICFTHPCRIHSLKFRAPESGHAPHEVRLFINQSNLDFTNVDGEVPPTQILFLSNRDFEVDQITLLDPHKFRKVKILSLFVVNNLGELPTTTIYQIQCIGKKE